MPHYARGGSSLQGEMADLTSSISDVMSIPGGQEMLMTVAAEELGQGGSKQLRLFNNRGGEVDAYADGGLAAAAEDVRAGGQGDDEILLHVSPEEYEALVGMWGEPEINPQTGLPEYGFLSKIWKKVKGAVKKIVKSPLFSLVAPVALNFFAPGLGSALGGMLGASGSTAATVGNTLIRGGIGALGGGKEGALAGAVSGLTMGGVGSKLGSKLGLEGELARYAGNSLIGGGASALTGGDFTEGALSQAQSSFLQPKIEGAIESGLGSLFPQESGLNLTPAGEGMGALPGSPEMSPIPSSGDLTVLGDPTAAQPGLFSRGLDWVKEHPWISAGAGLALAGGLSSRGGYDDQPPGLPPQFTEGLPKYDFNRSLQSLDPESYYTYGQVGAPQSGEFSFFDPNDIGSLPGSAPPQGRPDLVPADPLPPRHVQSFNPAPRGNLDQLLARLRSQTSSTGFNQGGYAGYARGAGSGREDTIEALLSDGEFVMDAETVSLLGDGSNNEGAKRLEELRENLRQHKGKALTKGKFSPDARRPEDYMRQGRSRYAGGGSVGRLIKKLERQAKTYEKEGSEGSKEKLRLIKERLKKLKKGQRLEKARGGRITGGQITEKERRRLRKRRQKKTTGAQMTSKEQWLMELAERVGE